MLLPAVSVSLNITKMNLYLSGCFSCCRLLMKMSDYGTESARVFTFGKEGLTVQVVD